MGLYEGQFPYADFHRLNLDWVLGEMKKLITEWADMQLEFTTLSDAFADLKSYCEDYFDTLDISVEVNDILTRMLTNGELDTILVPYISADVTTWLAANVTPVGSAVTVDTSLSIAGSAADAKATGDAITKNTTADNSHNSIMAAIFNGAGGFKSESTFDGVISLTTQRWTSMTTAKHLILPVNPGDVISITANSVQTTRYGILREYTESVANAFAPLSTATGFDTAIELARSASVVFTVPADGKFLYLAKSYQSTIYVPDILLVNGFNAFNGCFDVMTEERKVAKYFYGSNPLHKAIDHGGFYGNKPAYQNSPLAFYNSAMEGIRYHNLDIVFSSDGVPMVVHSATPTDTNGVTVAINSTTCAAIQTHTFGDADYGYTIMTLAEANEFIKDIGGIIDMVDLTAPNNATQQALAGTLPAYYRTNNIRPTWTNMDYDTFREAFQSQGPEFGLYLICNSASTLQDAITYANNHPGFRYCFSISYSDTATANAYEANKSAVGAVADAVYAYTYNRSNLSSAPAWADGLVSENCNVPYEVALGVTV